MSGEYEFQYRSGDTVLITGKDELEVILNLFSPNHECISPLTVSDIADHYATIVDLIRSSEAQLGLGNFAVLLLEDGQDIVLPVTAFSYVQMEIEETAADESAAQSSRIQPVNNDQESLVHEIAAQYIQSAYRRYKECKSDMKLRKKLSSELLILNLAAETISSNMRRLLNKERSKQEMDKLRLSRSGSLATSDVTMSVPTSARPAEVKPEPSLSPRTADRPLETKPTTIEVIGNAFTIEDLSMDDVPVAALDESSSQKSIHKNLYALVEYESNQCLFRTEVFPVHIDIKRQRVFAVKWSGKLLSVPIDPLDQPEHRSKEELLKLSLYSESLVVQDKLLALCQIQLPLLYSSHSDVAAGSSSKKRQAIVQSGRYSGSLFDSTSIVKRRNRGSVSFSWSITDSKPTASNFSPRSLREGSRCSQWDANSAVSNLVDVQDAVGSVNGLSPSLVMAAANTLNDLEADQEAQDIDEDIEELLIIDGSDKQFHDKSQSQRPSVISVDASAQRRVPKAWDEPLQLGIAERAYPHSPTTGTDNNSSAKNRNPQIGTMHRTFSSSSNTFHSASVAPSAFVESIVDMATEASNTRKSSINRPTSTITSSRVTRKSTLKNSTVAHTQPETGFSSGFSIKHEVRSMFDQAFYIALCKVAAGFQLRIKELIVLLDSLNIPINSVALQECLPSTARSYELSPLELKAEDRFDWLDETVSLPINHSTSFAASIADIITRFPKIVNPNGTHSAAESITLILNEKQCTLAIQQLVQLIKGDYDRTRSLIQAIMNGNAVIHQSIAQRNAFSHQNHLAENPLSSTMRSQFSSTSSLSTQSFAISAVKQLQAHGGGNHTATAASSSGAAGHSFEKVRPRRFSPDEVFELLSVLKLGNDFQYDRWASMMLSGSQLLTLSNQSIASAEIISASILQARFRCYQMTLQILDAAWDKGIRPQDQVNPPVEHTGTQGNSKKKTVENKSPRKRVRKHSMASDIVENSWTIVPIDGVQVKQLMSSSNSSLVEINAQAQTSIRSFQGDFYELSDVQRLFSQYLSHNRAFGWNQSLSSLTTLTHALAGFCGHRIAVGSQNEQISSSPSVDLHCDHDDFFWMMIDFPSFAIKQLALQSLLPLLQSSMSVNNSTTSSTNSSVVPQLLQVVCAVPFEESRSDNALLKCSLENIQVLVLAIRSCCSKAHRTGATGLDVGGSQGNGTSLLLRRLAHIDPKDVQVGARVQVAEISLLRRLCERFEWFDRPTADILSQFAGKEVEVISLAELHSKQRVGVRLFRHNQKMSTACEALPIEALTAAVETIDNDVEVTDESLGEKTIFDRVKSKLKQRMESAIENQNSNRVKSQTVPVKFRKSEEREDDEVDLQEAARTKKKIRRKSAKSLAKTLGTDKQGDNHQSLEKTLSQDLANLSVEDKLKPAVCSGPSDSSRVQSSSKARPQSANATNKSGGRGSSARPLSATQNRKTNEDEASADADIPISTTPVDRSWLRPRTAPIPLQQQLLQVDNQFPDQAVLPMASHGNAVQTNPVSEANSSYHVSEYHIDIPIDNAAPAVKHPTHTAHKTSAVKKQQQQHAAVIDERQRERESQLSESPFGVSGASYNTHDNKWNAPRMAFPVEKPIEETAAGENSPRAAHRTHAHAKASPSKVEYIPYRDSLPSNMEDASDAMGLAVHAHSPSRMDVDSSSSPIRPASADRNRVSKSMRSPKSPLSPSAEEQDREFVKATAKVDNIRQRPKSKQESKYYARETARGERAANRAEEVYRRELKRYGVKPEN